MTDAKSGGGPHGVDEGAYTPRDIWRIEALPEDLIASPLDLIFAEHLRHREAAQIMALIADREEGKRMDRKEIYAMLRDFLAKDLVRHTIEEEEVFFPLLRDQCEPQDGIDRLLARLSDEHAADRDSEAELSPVLASAADGAELGADVRRRLRTFSEHLRQHIALENAVLLPIARARLDAPALSRLGASLKALRATYGSDAGENRA